VSDAIVIGGGVMGLAISRELRRRGWAVSLLERAQPGRAASWASAGIIGATVREESDPTSELRRVSEQLWPAFARELQAESDMDPEYRETGCLYLAESEREFGWLERVGARARSHAAAGAEAASNGDGNAAHGHPKAPASEHDGAPAGTQTQTHAPIARETSGAGAGVEVLDQRRLHELEPRLAPGISGALRVAGGNVEPRRLCRALEIAARRAGVRIESSVEVRAITVAGERVSGVETADGARGADLVVLAAGAWSGTIRGLWSNTEAPPVHPQRGQILALDQAAVGVRHVLMTPDDPYFVPRCDGRLVIGATREEAGWDASLTAGGVAWLLNRALAIVPELRSAPIVEQWTGFRPLSADGVPLIGAGALEGLYLLTGHGPSGISPMPGSVALLAALIDRQPPPLRPEAFDPLRFAAAAASN
jgi:glycine oxidase